MKNPIKKEHVEKAKTLIIVSVATLVIGFAVGTHVERNSQQDMTQQYANGVASVSKPAEQK